MNNDERLLVEGILSGDESFLRTFYTTYSPYLHNFIRKRVGDEKDVEEIVQDTLLASLESLRDFTFSCTLSTFLCSIAKRKVVDFYRKKKLSRILFSHVPQMESLLAVLTTPEDELNEQLLREHVLVVFSRLKPRYQKILRLKYIEGFSVSEIAEKLSMSFKSVESMIFRARKAFVEIYSDPNSIRIHPNAPNKNILGSFG
ncbi:RNA polymerase sigma factor [Candidatus Roizmanbacteria bacterium]|nr:RNA polymerase sigma factor [Candidatus Roizmanbacteria bacterium]